MFDFLTRIGDWIKQGLIDAITAQFLSLFDFVNGQVGLAAANVGATPGQFAPGVFSMIRSLSNTAIVPIAGMILTFVMTYELIQMIMEKNNMHDFDTFSLYKWIFKTAVAVYLLTHTFDIVMAVFDVGQHVIGQSAGLIQGSLDVNAALTDLQAQMEAMSVWGVMGLWLEMSFVELCMAILSILIFVITFGRMIEIYLTVSVAPIPLATLANREWGQMGNNYLRSLFAMAFQGFLIMVCLGIYAALVQGIPAANDIHAAVWITVGYTTLLAFTLFKTGSLARSIFNAH
jgi:hypothetical protein